MEQFTASEVRGQIAWLRNVTVVGTKTTYQMLNAFADLLEAREKAVPVVWVNPDDLADPYFVGIGAAKAGHQDLGRHYTQPLYAHPAPSDAERLAEALHNLRDAQKHYMEHRTSASEIREPLGQLVAQRAAEADAVLATYSAQVQPPAASLSASEIEWLQYTVAHMEEDSEPEDRQCARVIRGLLARIGAAGEGDITNPPAASVTDAIARRMVAEYDAVLCGDPTATRTDGMRAALEAAPAAQENPNG